MRWYFVAVFSKYTNSHSYYGFRSIKARAEYIARDPENRAIVWAAQARKHPVHFFYF